MAEVSLELKEIKKSFTEGEAVLDNISLRSVKGSLLLCWDLRDAARRQHCESLPVWNSPMQEVSGWMAGK